MKKLGIIAVSALFALSGTACGSKKGQNKPKDNPNQDEIHTHSFGEWEVTKGASFEAEGIETRVCECGEEETRPIAKLVHTFSDTYKTNKEKHWKVCTDPGYSNLKIEEDFHTLSEVQIIQAPTCTEAGSGYRECTVCHERFQVVLNATGHSNVTKHEKIDSTCTSEGYEEYYSCDNEPGVYYTDETCTSVMDSIIIAPKGHKNVTRHPAIDATCTTDGNVEYYTCDREPGVYYADKECTTKLDEIVIPAHGHSTITKHEAKQPTCFVDGNIEYYTCENEPGVYYTDEACTNKVSIVVVRATGHDLNDTYGYDDEYHWLTCKNDPTEQLAKAKHTFGALEVITKPTYTTTGLGTQKCTVCDKTIEVIIPVAGHGKITHHEAVEATCTTDGNIEYYTCEAEPDAMFLDETLTTYVDDVIIPATGHKNVQKHYYKEPTCLEDGHVTYYTCDNEPGVYFSDSSCKTIIAPENVIIPATGHGTITHHEQVDPTCMEYGTKEYWSCSKEPDVYYDDAECTHQVTREELDIYCDGHGDMTFHPQIDPTCTEDGTRGYYTCSKEPDTNYYVDYIGTTRIYDLTIPKLGHKITDYYVYDSTDHWFTCEHDNTEKFDVEPHEDCDSNHVCDICGAKLLDKCFDNDKNHFCDVCNEFLPAHQHEDYDTIDHICDYCGKDLTYYHDDTDLDNICDICGRHITPHADNDFDHKCDFCHKTLSLCEDKNRDHYCDICGAQMTHHKPGLYDDNSDHICDFCGKEITNAHYDNNHDNICDACDKPLPFATGHFNVNEKNISLGNNETIYFTTEVSGINCTESSVYFKIDSNKDRFTLVDNGDGTCSISLSISGTVFSATTMLTMHSTVLGDDVVLDAVRINYVKYSATSTVKQYLEKVLPSYTYIPVLAGITFNTSTVTKSMVEGVIQYSGDYGFNSAVDSFRLSNNFIEVIEGDVHYFYRSDDYYLYEFRLSENQDQAGYVDYVFKKLDTRSSKFPLSNIARLLSISDSNIISPDDGWSFEYAAKDRKVVVSNDSDASNYSTKLLNNGYTLVSANTYLSPDRTLVVTVNDGEFIYSLQKVSSASAWNEYSLKLMNDELGIEIPFIGGEFGEWYKLDDKIATTSKSLDANKVATAFFDADNSYTKVSDNQYVKSVGEITDLIITITESTITAYTAVGQNIRWNSAGISIALTKTEEELPRVILPTSEGAYGFEYNVSNEKVTIKVNGDSTTKDNYVAKLLDEGFTLDATIDENTTRYSSKNGTLKVEITVNSSTSFTLMAYTSLPTNEYIDFPIDEIVNVVGEDKKELLKAIKADGTYYKITNSDEKSITLSVEGQDMYDYMLLLHMIGCDQNHYTFTYDDLTITVENSTDSFYITYSIN